MTEKNTARIDKWLWAVRIYKTRTMATDACAGGKVKMNNKTVKASRMIHPGNLIQVRKEVVKYEYIVLKIAEKRMGAKIVQDFVEDVTKAKELEKLKISKDLSFQTRKKGKGRPTKKERRIIDKIKEQY